MKPILLLISFILFVIIQGLSQSNFSFSGYTSGQNFTTHNYTHTNTPIANCVTMSTRVTHSGSSFINLTGAMSPNYHANYACSQAGLYLASNRTTSGAICTVELSFSEPVCAPLTFTITDINGANVSLPTYGGFRDDVTISAFDQTNTAIPLTTSMVTNNGTSSCNGGSYNSGSYTHTSGNSLRIVGCTYDDCAIDYFTIYSSTRMISRIVIAYNSGNADWGGTTISNPDLQYIIINNVRAWTPCFNITPNCGPPISLTANQLSPFPPLTAGSGRPNASYPNPSILSSTAATYQWTGTAGTISSPTPASMPATTNITSLPSGGGTFTITGQNNRGCIASKSIVIDNTVCTSLPIELLTFEGICFNSKRNFYWSTATEQNNDYFLLEQSKNGIDFYSAAKVQGAGNSTELKTYSFSIDNAEGNYFRLRQVDFDGNESISEIIFVECQKPSNQGIIHPNPFQEFIEIDLNEFVNKDLKIEILNFQGQVIKDFIFDNNQIIKNTKMRLPLVELNSGIYYFDLKDSNSLQSLKRIKIVKT